MVINRRQFNRNLLGLAATPLFFPALGSEVKAEETTSGFVDMKLGDNYFILYSGLDAVVHFTSHDCCNGNSFKNLHLINDGKPLVKEFSAVYKFDEPSSLLKIVRLVKKEAKEAGEIERNGKLTLFVNQFKQECCGWYFGEDSDSLRLTRIEY